ALKGSNLTFATDIYSVGQLLAFLLVDKPEVFDPRTYLTESRKNVKALVSHKIRNVLGSEGKL
ncbi:MAG: hypothetical protein IJO52_08375, partial [Clostridia bacterium]|nr:hypothetical protein [Clostridia bacterium]